jgi:alpha-tubulin suppressor-like RCC1 family protein
MWVNKREKIGWVLLWVAGIAFLFGSAGCKKKSAQTGQAGFPSSTTGQTTFTSPDNAATKTFGSLSAGSDNIITARASQSEMITGRMITGRAITARIITGRIITARSPKFMNVSESNNNDNENDILNLFGRLKKSRLSKKQSEESEISCEDVKPKCVDGKVEKAECNIDQSTNRLIFDIKVSDCKEIVDEQKGDYIVSTGYARGYLEISTKVSQGSSEARFIFAIEEGDSLVKEFIGNKETKRVRAKASNFRTEITGRFIEGEKDVDFRVATKLSGSYSREDEIGNRKEAYSYSDYVVELTGRSPKSGGEPTLYVSIAGGYSVDTTPDVECVEGVFNFKTIKPIKSSGGQGYCGAESGEIEVNNAKMEFSSGKVKVSVENQQKEYGCEELGGLCKYEPIKIAEGVEQKPCPVWFKDADGDGYTDGVTKVSCEQPAGYVSQAQTGDCNDNDKNINPNTVWFKDKDKDGYTDGTTKVSCEKPSDEYVSSATAGDCDDNDTNINPVRAEICDGLDNDCNGTIDDGVLLVFYKDLDGDGYTDGATQVGCSAPQGYVLSATTGDCNDSDSSMNSGRAEICDNKDNNCNGQIDEGVLLVFYRDQDGDGYGYANNSTQACSQPAGYVSNSSDCDDNNANLHPNTIWFKDADFDGYYPAGGSSVSCNNPFAPNNATYVAIPGGDCNDTNPSIHPGAPLNCNNGLDNDCSGNVEKWAYTDQDGDRYAPNNVSSCIDVVSFPGKITAGQELGYNDCNDNDASINPNTIWFKDADSDNFYPPGGSQVSCTDPYPENSTYFAIPGGDCDDNNPTLNPNTIWFKDADLDGYYPPGGSSVSCNDPYPENSTYSVIPGNDCNDSDNSVNPNATELCDGLDNNCNAKIDEGFAPCSAPSNLTYISYSVYSVLLNWKDNSPNEEAFVVEISTSASFTSPVTQIFPANTTQAEIFFGELYYYSFGQPKNAADEVFYFRIYAANLTGNSTYSNTVHAPEFFNDVITVSAGPLHTCAIKQDGSLWCWGRNSDGQLGDGTNADKNTPVQIMSSGVSSISLGGFGNMDDYTCAIKQDGSLWCWGSGYGNTPTQVISSGVVAVETGSGHTCAIKIDGSLWCWGYNNYGQCGDGNFGFGIGTPVQIMSSGVSAVSAGGLHTCAIKQDGSLWCWGRNYEGQLGDGTNGVNDCEPMIIEGNDCNISPTQITIDASAISLGWLHTCAIKTDGSLWCWGANDYGQVGNGTAGGSVSSPVQIMPSGVSSVSLGGAFDLDHPGHTCAIKQDGSLWCWGYNHNGQLGNGTGGFWQYSSSPTRVISSGVSAVSAGGFHTCAIKTDGSLWCWGENAYGQLGNGTNSSQSYSPVRVIFRVQSGNTGGAPPIYLEPKKPEDSSKSYKASIDKPSIGKSEPNYHGCSYTGGDFGIYSILILIPILFRRIRKVR